MGSLWEHNVQNTEEFGKVHFEKKLQKTNKICKLLIVLVHVLTLKSQNDNYHEIHIKKNPICILNFLHEHVPTVYEKKMTLLSFIKKN